MWVQDRVARGDIEIKKVGTESNLADILTKHIDRERLDRHLSSMSFSRVSGHSNIALRHSAS